MNPVFFTMAMTMEFLACLEMQAEKTGRLEDPVEPFSSPPSPVPVDAVLTCEFRTEKDQNPRIEWKKKGKGVAFVYFNGTFTSK